MTEISWTIELLKDSVNRMMPGTELDPESIKSGFLFALEEINEREIIIQTLTNDLLKAKDEFRKYKEDNNTPKVNDPKFHVSSHKK